MSFHNRVSQGFRCCVCEVLQLSQRHVGYSYRVVMSYEDGHGTKELLVTSPSETVQGEVLITGEVTVR